MPEPKKMKEKNIQTRPPRPARAKKMKEKSNQTSQVIAQTDEQAHAEQPKLPPKPKMKEKLIQTRADPLPKQKILREVVTQTPAAKQVTSIEVQTNKLLKDTEI